MYNDDQTAQISASNATLADCQVSREEPYGGDVQRHIGFAGHEAEYCGYREVRTFAGFGVSLLKPDRTPLPLYRDKDGRLRIACEDGESFVAELHVQKGGDRWAALLAINGKQQHLVSPSTGDSTEPVYHIVTEPRGKGDNIISGWAQPAGTVQPFVAQSEEHQDAKVGECARYGVVTCSFYSEYHPDRFVSPTLRGPMLSGYVAGMEGVGLFDARGEGLTVCRRFNTSVEIRFAPRSEIERLGFIYVPPDHISGPAHMDLRMYTLPLRPGGL